MSNTDNLPPLPVGYSASDWGGRDTGPCLYEAAQMREFGNQQFNAGREFERERRAALAQPAQPDADLQRRTGEPQPAASGEPAYKVTVVDDDHPAGIPYEQWVRPKANAQPAPAPANDRPTRADFVRVARCFALAYGLHADAPDYLPRTDEARDAFEPHAWVIALAMQAHHDGKADGLSQPAPALVPLTDAQIDKVTLDQWGEQLGAMLQAHRAYARAILAAAAPDAPTDQSHPQR